MTDPAPDIRVAPDAAALAEAAARLVAEAAGEAVAAHGSFSVALAGGGTPRATYERLARPPLRERIPWDRVRVFFGDERAVPPDHPESNYGMARAALLDHVPIPAAQVFRIRGEATDLDEAAAEYAGLLGPAGGWRTGGVPRFDLVLLGLGLDGHTASLFPGSPALQEAERLAVAVHVPAAAIPRRVTLTLPVLNGAARVVFLVAGAEKARVLRAVLTDDASLPAARVRPAGGRLVWLLDREAAALLDASPPR